MNNICSDCGRPIKGNGLKGMCRTCYQRYKRYLTMPIYDLPKKGEIKYSPDGKVICHICGRAFHKVLTHAWQVHDVLEKDYKKDFGLNASTSLISEATKEKHTAAVMQNYSTVVSENLISKGTSTRFKTGGAGRTKEKIRLQCLNELIKRAKGMGVNSTNKVSNL